MHLHAHGHLTCLPPLGVTSHRVHGPLGGPPLTVCMGYICTHCPPPLTWCMARICTSGRWSVNMLRETAMPRAAYCCGSTHLTAYWRTRPPEQQPGSGWAGRGDVGGGKGQKQED